jgi:hypothetical protein
VSELWRLSSFLYRASVPFASLPVSLSPSLLAFLLHSEHESWSVLFGLSRDDLLHFLIVEVKSHDDASTYSLLNPGQTPLVGDLLRLGATRARCTQTRAVLIRCSLLCLAFCVVLIGQGTPRASCTPRPNCGWGSSHRRCDSW